MKKIVSLLLALCICCSGCLVLSSCSDDSNISNSNTNNSKCSHNWVDADCENPKHCSKCNETVGTALGHTTTTGKCNRCGKNFGTWEIGEFVDEFNQPIGKKYVSTQVNGSFSNSATSNSELTAFLQITSEDVAIILLEYGSSLVKCSYKWDEYSITMKDTNGTKYYLNGTMYAGSERIYFDSSDEATVINALKKSGSVSFYVALSDRTITNYLFTVETSNFKDLYSEIK